METATHIKEAFKQLANSKMRSFLAMLGILVGTASVVANVSIGQLSEEQILLEFKNMGINLLSISINSNDYSQSTPNPNDSLSLSSAMTLKQSSSNIEHVAPYISSYGDIIFQGKSLDGSVTGIDPSMISIANLKISQGRQLTFLDKNSYYCVIGNQVYQSIKKQGFSNPLGQQIKVGSTYFTIVGVLQDWPSNFFFNTDFNSDILIPVQTAMAIQKNPIINSVAVKIFDTTQMHTTINKIKAYIKLHTINQRVDVQSPKSLIDNEKKSSQTMTLLLAMIGSISLLVGGIGVMNIMLVSVAERQKEIGIRLAIGARQKDIQMQFLFESVTLSITGGIIGMLIGLVVTFGVSLYSHWHFQIFFLPPLAGCLISVLIGIFFGFYPARKASKLDPIQTLRSD